MSIIGFDPLAVPPPVRSPLAVQRRRSMGAPMGVAMGALPQELGETDAASGFTRMLALFRPQKFTWAGFRWLLAGLTSDPEASIGRLDCD